MVVFLLTIQCKHLATNNKQFGKSQDSIFLKMVSKIPPIKLPISFRRDLFMAQKDDGKSLGIYSYGIYSENNIDSLFARNYISNYDNFYPGDCYHYLKTYKLNDSVYIVIYTTEELDNSYGPIIIHSYNFSRSTKPIDKLVLYSYSKGSHQLESYITNDWVIKSNFQISNHGICRDCSNQTPLIYVHIKNYKLNTNGKFELIYWLDGESFGKLNEEGHFYLPDSALTTPYKEGKLIIQNSIKKYTHSLNHERVYIDWKGDIIKK